MKSAPFDVMPRKRSECFQESCSNPIVARVIISIRQAAADGNGPVVTSTTRSFCERHAAARYTQLVRAFEEDK